MSIKFKLDSLLKSHNASDKSRTFSMSVLPQDTDKTRGVFDEPNLLAEFSLSSEVPYLREYEDEAGNKYPYYEVLGHEEGEIDFSRLKNGSNLFLNHHYNKKDSIVLGLIESVELKNKRIIEIARFSDNPEPMKVFNDIKKRIRGKVSVGYTIKTIIDTGLMIDEIPVLRATRWLPHESSVVDIAADDSIGFEKKLEFNTDSLNKGMALVAPELEKELSKTSGGKTEINFNLEVKTMTPEELATQEKLKADAQKTADIKVGETYEKSVQDILAAGKTFNQLEMAAEFVSKKKSLADFQNAIQEKFDNNPELFLKKGSKDADDIGMSEKDISKWSLMNYVKTWEANRNNGGGLKCFETDVSQEVEKQTGKKAKGLLLPVDILRGKGITANQKQQRAMSVGTTTAGGYLQNTTLLTDMFVDVLRNTDITSQLGFTVINGLRGLYNIPRKTSAATVGWVAENGSTAESTAAYDLIAMSAKAVHGQSISSREARMQLAVDADAFMLFDLITSLNNDKASKYFNGTGSSNQITGILTQSSINSISPSANGDAPTWALMNQMKKELRIDNIQGVIKLIINAATEYALAITPKVTALDHYLLDEQTGRVAGMETFITNMLPSNITKGSTVATLSKAIALEPTNVVIGNWGGIDIIIDPYTYSSDFRLKISAIQDTDLVLKHPEAVCVFADIITA